MYIAIQVQLQHKHNIICICSIYKPEGMFWYGVATRCILGKVLTISVKVIHTHGSIMITAYFVKLDLG